MYITAYCIVYGGKAIKIRKRCCWELFSERVLGLYCSGVSEKRGETRIMGDMIVW